MVDFDDVLGCLELQRLGEGRYTAPNIPMPYRRVFGGQLLAQAIAVAAAAAEGKSPKSIHVSFPREGDLAKPVEYRVQRLQEGRSFASLWIEARQGETSILGALVSLHAEEPGLSHQLDAPEVGTPEDAAPVDLSMIPWETRMVGGVDLASDAVGPPSLELWMRAPALPDDPVIHQALFAYASDLTLIGTALRPHEGVSEAHVHEKIATAVTTHTVWFHRPLRMDDWILVAQESPTAAGARGFGLGHAYSRDGVLVASFGQESLIRPLG
ncbi:MAG: thioesterase family protein [Deltaproteobacteria bacterium]|nr:thioesterase family protein [Deltaproteobacteria bacterium]MBW2420418.1 thioesterase family protein [Deltaproteobacteria bacterium]